MKRKICVVTGSRAEYGLLRPLLQEIKRDGDMKLQLIVTGMHLSREFGLTYKEIEKDKFVINERVEILTGSDTPAGIAKSMGRAMSGLAEAYERLQPDVLVVLGDRFEIFSAAAAALVSRITLVHIGGGEITEGAFDESLRHSITKMGHLHFVSTEEYRKRVIQLGENPKRVFNVGAIGLDNIRQLKLLSKKQLEKALLFRFNKRNLLVTFHPVTLEKGTASEQCRQLLTALEELADTHIIFTKANADTNGRVINTMIDEYVSRNPDTSIAFTSMGQVRYLSVMRFIDAVIGNSSSGIIEAPSFKIATINIGDRQKGRIRTKSIIDCEPTKKSILKAFETVYSKKFQSTLKKVKSPYGDGRTALKIKACIKKFDFTTGIKKKFYNFNSEKEVQE